MNWHITIVHVHVHVHVPILYLIVFVSMCVHLSDADGVLDMVMVSCDGPSSCHIHLLMQKSLSGVLDCKSRDASKWNITWGGVS